MQFVEGAFEAEVLPKRNEAQEATAGWKWYHLLPIVAAAIYVFSPILEWRFGFPGATKYLGDALVAVMIGLVIGRILLVDRIPGAFLVILALTIIGSIVAAFERQPGSVTVYGWWLMFRYPFVGLYVYMVPDWPKSVASLLPKVLTILLGFEVAVQAVLYLTGTRDFDNLAGTFGQKGVGPFVFFILLVLAINIGRWLTDGKWQLLGVTLLLGSFASAIGEMKLFIIAAPLMAAMALFVHLIRGAQPRRVVVYLFFIAVAFLSFLYAYDIYIVQNLGRPPLEEYLNEDRREHYLENVRGSAESYRLGRNTEAEYGWQLMQRDVPTLVFGHGLGTRQYSPELGLVGEGLEDSLYGLFVGRSLLVIMYEMGLVGLSVMLLFIILTSVILYQTIKRDPDQDMNVLRYGVILYTVFWPVWIWYKAIWVMPAPSILYWMVWGYVMHYSINFSSDQQSSNADSISQLKVAKRPLQIGYDRADS